MLKSVTLVGEVVFSTFAQRSWDDSLIGGFAWAIALFIKKIK